MNRSTGIKAMPASQTVCLEEIAFHGAQRTLCSEQVDDVIVTSVKVSCDSGGRCDSAGRVHGQDAVLAVRRARQGTSDSLGKARTG